MKKKLLSAALIALVSISLASCDESLDDLSDLETGDEESSEVEPSTPGDPETPEHTHRYDEGVVTKEATCTEEGSKVYTCECGETYTETIEALGHDYVLTTTVEPTCGEAGSKVYVCSRCDATYTETLDATGEHTWDSGTVTKEATCTEAGEITYTCSVCQDTKTEPIEALGHDFENGTYVHDDTYHWKKCSRCEVEDTENKVAHTWDSGTTTTAPSCTEAGETTYTCTECEATKTSEISATGHSWSEWTEVTGTDTHSRSCSICSETETESHTWNEGEITTAATCDKDGVKTYTCTVCGATKTESIDALGHTLGGEYYGKGEAWYQYCSVCGSYVAVDAPTEAGSFTVTDETSLVTAISLGGYITFGDDICISKTLALYDNATLDLAGHKLYNVEDCYLGNDIISDGCSLLSIRGDISVTITGNGTFDSKENDCFAFDMSKGGAASTAEKGPNVTIESGTYIGNIDSVYVAQGELTVLDGYFSVKQLYNGSRQWTLNLEDADYRNGEASAILYGGSYEGFDPSASYSEATLLEGYYSWETGTIVVDGSNVSIYTVEYAPFAYDTPALFGFDVNGTTNYITGGVIGNYTYEGALTTNRNDAVWVTLSRGDGSNGYYMTFDDSGTTKYICIETVNGYQDLQYETTAAMIYWDSEHECWTNQAGTYFLCYYSNYTCLYASAISYISSNPIAQFYGFIAPTSLTISGNDTLEVGKSTTLSVTANSGADNFVTWSSSDEEKATIDENGRVTAVEEGEVTITATSIIDADIFAEFSMTIIEAGEEKAQVLLATYDFSKKTDTTNSVRTTSQMVTIFNESFTAGEVSTNPISSVTTADTIYAQAGGGSSNSNLQLSTACIKFGKSSTKGELAFTVSGITINQVDVVAAGWSSSQPLTINGVQQSITQSAGSVSSVSGLNTYSYTIDENTVIDMVTSERVLVFSLVLYGYIN